MDSNSLEKLHQTLRKCNKCDLHKTCTQVVPGEGPQNAAVIFFAEGPEEKDDKEGRPFIGEAGRTFRNALRKANIDQEDVYISNTVRCLPPDDREPSPEEADACWDWTLKTLQIIRPKVVVTLGRPALFTLAYKLNFTKQLGQNPISKLAGKPIYLEDRHFYLYPMFHPDIPSWRREARAEFNAHMKYLSMAIPSWLDRP